MTTEIKIDNSIYLINILLIYLMFQKDNNN